MGNLDELQRRGSGIAIFFVKDGKVDQSHILYSDEHPEDLTIVKEALRKVAELGKFELIFKDNQRMERKNSEKHT